MFAGVQRVPSCGFLCGVPSAISERIADGGYRYFISLLGVSLLLSYNH